MSWQELLWAHKLAAKTTELLDPQRTFCKSCHFRCAPNNSLPAGLDIARATTQRPNQTCSKGLWVSACQEVSQLWVVRAGAKHIFSYLLWQGHETKLSHARHTRCQGLPAISSKANFSSTSRSVARPSFASTLKNSDYIEVILTL